MVEVIETWLSMRLSSLGIAVDWCDEGNGETDPGVLESKHWDGG